MSTLVGTNTYWGIPSLYNKNASVVFGTVHSANSSWLSKVTQGMNIKFFTQAIPTKQTPLAKANNLRIPASTWKKMDDKFEQQKKLQRQKMSKVLEVENGNFHSFCMKEPLRSKIVSKFASPRTLPNGRSYYHTGVDLRAWTGTPIPSIGPGTIVLAEKMIVPGNVVVVDHGGGVFSRYLHLDKFKVKIGDFVKTGQLVGLAGGTGRVEAPHLHWEVIWRKRLADPHRFVASMNELCSHKKQKANAATY